MRFLSPSLTLVGFTSLLASAVALTGCGSSDPSTPGGTGATNGAGAGSGAGAGTGAGGTQGTGAGGTQGTGATGGSGNATGAGGSTGNAGGTNSTGGTPGTGGSAAGGTSGGAGGSSGGSGGSTEPGKDANGKGIAQPGDMSSDNQDYLRIGPEGEIRILNNNWGSEDLNCQGSAFSVFYNQDKSFGWTFDRPACGGNNEHPDFPQIEFGIHPFGVGNDLVTSPEFSSTTLLPLQIKDIQTASVSIENLTIMLDGTQNKKWNITFEFWLSQTDPRLENTTGQHRAYAELMTFWGWEANRWPDIDPDHAPVIDNQGLPGTLSSGGKNYKLWVNRDNWANGWRYFQFRDTSGPSQSFNGNVDVKALLTYLTTNLAQQYNGDLWVTRLEVGSEIDDNTKGKVQLDNITFEVNGQSRSAGKAH